jgi:hypothetical protein
MTEPTPELEVDDDQVDDDELEPTGDFVDQESDEEPTP